MFTKSFKEDLGQALKDDALSKIDLWDNKLAEGMMSIPQEVEAFGETMPEPQFELVDSDCEDRGAA